VIGSPYLLARPKSLANLRKSGYSMREEDPALVCVFSLAAASKLFCSSNDFALAVDPVDLIMLREMFSVLVA
jgi:hypothetical protein